MTDKEQKKLMGLFRSGAIVICPICSKVDINPNEHFKKCNPTGEKRRIENLETYWSN